MKMIDVLSLLAKGEIEENTTLIVSNGFKEFEYKYRKIYRTFVDEDLCKFDGRFNIDEDFLNWKVRLEQPSEQKYYIKLPNTDYRLFLCKYKDGEVKLYPIKKVIPMIDIFIRAAEECGVTYKTEFTKQDFEEIEEIRAYEQFKELVKDDENE